jgi:hypothetical protein
MRKAYDVLRSMPHNGYVLYVLATIETPMVYFTFTFNGPPLFHSRTLYKRLFVELSLDIGCAHLLTPEPFDPRGR